MNETKPKTIISLSVVVPLYNEEENVSALTGKLILVLDSLGEEYEIILVNDGSSDQTWKQIEHVSKSNKRIKACSFSRNFGHQHAIYAGLVHSKGNAIVSMDGDLQHPPEVIPQLVAAWKEGFKVVVTHREDAEETGLFKRLTSKYFYGIFSSMTGVRMSAQSSDFRLLDRAVVDSLLQFNDVDLFLRGAVSWLGFPSKTIRFKAVKRFKGETKYNLQRMLKFANGAIVSFSVKPLIYAVWIGVATSTLAFLEILFIVIQYIRGETVPGWASTVGIISLLFGILFIILGIIGIYLARIHQSLQNRPRFVVSDSINLED
ncbi:MAG: glycosyltransferase family 2 protein [Bacteroidales bacterium]|nr:glycosyltransferase family 2 protein [Bacteroidales bacterium]MCF8454672.1 glycosyltransferase family 2 protein [Bacteroidales bacterium]